jgi:ribA/ribD-fused uncharacterized protein
MEIIMEFRGQYRFLSNFYPCPFNAATIDNTIVIFPTVEHYFQAWKTTNKEDFFKIVSISNTPAQAKRLGRKVKLRPDWEVIKDRVMLYAVTQKFLQNPVMLNRLQATKGKLLVEGNRWGDTYWGFDINKGKGLNKLGITLMYIRDLL